MAIPKVTKTGKQLNNCKKGQIVKFPTSMAQRDIEQLAEKYRFRIWFFESSDIQYQKHGRNTVRLM